MNALKRAWMQISWRWPRGITLIDSIRTTIEHTAAWMSYWSGARFSHKQLPRVMTTTTNYNYRNTESTAHALVYSGPDLWCCLVGSCLLRVCFCSCSVWYAATLVPWSRSLILWLVRFAYSFTRCLPTKTVLSFLQIFFERGWRPVTKLEATESELWRLLPYTLIRVSWSGLGAIA